MQHATAAASAPKARAKAIATIMTMTGDPPHVSGEKRNVDMDGH